MFIVFLKFSANKAAAPDHMEGHKQWLQQGFDDGVFLVAGSLQPGLGGGIVAHATTRADLDARLGADPFVVEDVGTADGHEIDPARADDRLTFLLT